MTTALSSATFNSLESDGDVRYWMYRLRTDIESGNVQGLHPTLDYLKLATRRWFDNLMSSLCDPAKFPPAKLSAVGITADDLRVLAYLGYRYHVATEPFNGSAAELICLPPLQKDDITTGLQRLGAAGLVSCGPPIEHFRITNAGLGFLLGHGPGKATLPAVAPVSELGKVFVSRQQAPAAQGPVAV